MVTLSVWNPHCDSYAENKESMIDWEGSMIEKQDRKQIFLSDIPKDNSIMASVQISSSESAAINQVLQRSDHVLG